MTKKKKTANVTLRVLQYKPVMEKVDQFDMDRRSCPECEAKVNIEVSAASCLWGTCTGCGQQFNITEAFETYMVRKA